MSSRYDMILLSIKMILMCLIEYLFLICRNFVDYETCTGRSSGGSKSSKTKSAKAKSSKVEHAVDAKAEKMASSSEKVAKSSKVYKSKTVFN